MLSRIPKSTLVLLCFTSVYLIWGSTYVAIHVAGEQLPVPVVGATRSLISASLIVLICVARGKSLRVGRAEALRLALVGLLFMTCNNLMLTWGETMVPSGFASLVISTTPIVIALLEMVLGRLGYGGDALNKRGWAGTLLGTAGIAVLVWPSLHGHGMAGSVTTRPLLGTVVLLGAAASFAVGSVLSRRFQFRADTLVATGYEIGAAGLCNAGLAVATGGLHRAVWTLHGVEAIFYLSVFGSLFGLVSFTYLLKNVAVTKVATYAFVNPMIAVILGVMLLHERLAKTELAGMAVIVCGVAMVIYSRVDRGKETVEEAVEEEIGGESGHALE
jgi:drug/metabolite transporter (DMT)-like permease